MATYSQDSQRLVIVATNSQASTVALAPGFVQVIRASGAPGTVALGAKIKICFATNKTPHGVIAATGKLNLVSESFDASMVVQSSTKGFKAPQEQIQTINVGTAIPNNQYYITVDMDGYGSTSVQNTLQVYATYVSTAADTNLTIAAGLVANLNKNVSRAGVNRVIAAVTSAGAFTITGQPQAVINFNNPWSQLRFRASLNDTFAADATNVLTQAANKGFGFGPEVANIEHFAQGSEANWQWLDFPTMYPRDLYANPAQSYDCVSIRLKTTNEGFGSNISSFRQIDIFGVDGTLTALIADLNTVIGAGNFPAIP